jgi:hypothetical protein
MISFQVSFVSAASIPPPPNIPFEGDRLPLTRMRSVELMKAESCFSVFQTRFLFSKPIESVQFQVVGKGLSSNFEFVVLFRQWFVSSKSGLVASFIQIQHLSYVSRSRLWSNRFQEPARLLYHEGFKVKNNFNMLSFFIFILNKIWINLYEYMFKLYIIFFRFLLYTWF